MPKNYFRFKQFTVQQDKCAMKIGTDAVLLGAWAEVEASKSILDIGTGTGVIALMVAQRTVATIDAIDIDQNAAIQAAENFAGSPWAERLKSQHIGLKEFANETKKKYDLIITNPPFFSNSLNAVNAQRNKARHAVDLPFEDLVSYSYDLLTEQGALCLILPISESEKFISIAEEHHLYLTKQTIVKSRIASPPIRMMMQFEKQKKTLLKEELSIENLSFQDYTEQYISLTKDYYVNF